MVRSPRQERLFVATPSMLADSRISASRSRTRAIWAKQSRPTARRSACGPTMPRTTSTSAMPCALRATQTPPPMRTARRSGSNRISPQLVTAWAGHCSIRRISTAHVAAYREAIHLAPGDADYRYNLGLALAEKGELDVATAAFREALRLRPNSAEAQRSLGRTELQAGRMDAAIHAYRSLVRLTPRAPMPTTTWPVHSCCQAARMKRSDPTARPCDSSPSSPRHSATSARRSWARGLTPSRLTCSAGGMSWARSGPVGCIRRATGCARPSG